MGGVAAAGDAVASCGGAVRAVGAAGAAGAAGGAADGGAAGGTAGVAAGGTTTGVLTCGIGTPGKKPENGAGLGGGKNVFAHCLPRSSTIIFTNGPESNRIVHK